MSERKAVIKNADMSEDMQQDAVDCASQALEKYNIEKARHCRLHQEGVRQEVQRNLALHCGPQLWVLRYPRDEALHLLLLGPGKWQFFSSSQDEADSRKRDEMRQGSRRRRKVFLCFAAVLVEPGALGPGAPSPLLASMG
ncbi:unnamed protein product [Ectocarpus sp. CCAP 1310/34]|nr:unnamed protein product [Ectocarpus sp. CCAP 1310/34]